MAMMVRVGSRPGAPRTHAAGQEWRGVVETLLRERRQALQGPPAAREGGPDRMDAARELEEEAVWLAVLDRSRDMQATVEEALRRVATGQYGRCAECGQHIALARLRALPFAVRCLACQERMEREGAGRRTPVARHGGAGAFQDARSGGASRTMAAPTPSDR